MEKRRFPSDEELKRMRKKLSRAKGTYGLPPDTSVLDRAKYDVCGKILVYMHRKGLTQRQLASLMEIPETRVSEIVHYRIYKFTLDRLVGYYEKINPKASLKVA